MANNLATKYSDKIATEFTHASYLKGKSSSKYDFTGVRGLKIYTPTTVAENDYVRDGMNRYGTPVEMQDTVQELVMTQDKSFALTIDKGNNLDQMNIKGAGEMLQLQLKERSIPTADKYALTRWVECAGKTEGLAAKPTKDNITGIVADCVQFFDDNLIPDGNRFIGVTGEIYKMLKLSPEWLGVDKLGERALEKGEVGEVQGLRVVKLPTSYLPADCYFLAWIPEAVMFPYKISDAKYHKDPPGLSGDLLEGRHYYDAFVLGAKANGVYTAVLGSKKAATPTITNPSGGLTIVSSGAAKIKYTLDGSDPRYSDKAEVYSAPVAGLPKGALKVRAVAYKTDGFVSDLALGEFTIA